MALFSPPDPQFVFIPKNNDQMAAHRRMAMYPGNDPFKMINSVLYYLKHVLGIEWAPFHKVWIVLAITKVMIGVIAFRGSTKSTIFQGYTSWKMQRALIPGWKNPDDERGYRGRDIAIGSYSKEQLKKEWFPNLRIMLELSRTNLDLEWKYSVDNKAEIIIGKKILFKGKFVFDNHTLGRALGFGINSAIRMIHPDEWIIDDWLDKRMKGTVEEATRIFKQDVAGTRTEIDSKIFVIGTILWEGDLLDDIKHGRIGVIEYAGEFTPYLDEARTIPRWHKRGKEFLEQQAAIQGEDVFEIEYMLNPISDKAALIKRKYMEAAKLAGEGLYWDRDKTDGTFIISGNDFQASESSDSDWGVNIGLEIFPDKPRIRPIYIDRYQGRDSQEIYEHNLDYQRKYNIELNGFETNGFQVNLARYVRRQSITFPIFEHVTGTERNQFDVGIPSLKQIFHEFDIALPTGDKDPMNNKDLDLTLDFIKEMSGWQFSTEHKKYVHRGRYKDISMAFWIAILTLREMEGGSAEVMAIEL